MVISHGQTREFLAGERIGHEEWCLLEWEPVIGLEIHVELSTRSKLFCPCSTAFGGDPNSQVCPVCLGLPGVLPTVNRYAVDLLLRTAMALHCTVSPRSKFDRKNYFYPDMPKNYQISQYDLPLATGGFLLIGSEKRRVSLKRIHLEEDTGKSIHVGEASLPLMAAVRGASQPSHEEREVIGGKIGQSVATLLDYNRAGVPLMEIVTEPDLSSPDEAHELLLALKQILQYLEVSDCKMEEGSLRCDANVSLRLCGSRDLGTKTEIKNMNSFKAVKLALNYEIQRQKGILGSRGEVIQETRGWDEGKGETFSMRGKEEAHDYRYFPEPDLVPLEIGKEFLEKIKHEMPELPDLKMERLQRDLSLSRDEAEFLCSSKALADQFEEAVCLHREHPKAICNWYRGEIASFVNSKKVEWDAVRAITPSVSGGICQLVDSGRISGKMAKVLILEALEKGFTILKDNLGSDLEAARSMAVEAADPGRLVNEKGLAQMAREEELRPLISDVVRDPASRKAIEEFLTGKERAFGFLVGQVMKKTQGKANPQVVNALLREELNALSRE